MQFEYETRMCTGGCGYSWRSNVLDQHDVCESCLYDWYVCNDCDQSPICCRCKDCPCENGFVVNAHKRSAPDAGKVEYVETRRGTIAIVELPARGPLPPAYFWSVGWTQGESGSRAYAITDAYVAMVRSETSPLIVRG